MNCDYLFIVNSILLFIICYFTFHYYYQKVSETKLKYRRIKVVETVPTYINYQICKKKIDLCSYDKYELWHYIEKRRRNIQ